MHAVKHVTGENVRHNEMRQKVNKGNIHEVRSHSHLSAVKEKYSTQKGVYSRATLKIII